jgi:translocation and assembly module TamB
MRWLTVFLVAIVGLAAWMAGSQPGRAQAEDDRGFLTRLLEQSLSGAGRSVTIDGFAGALSSRATFRRLSIADGTGVWLVIEDGAIAWTRSALLSGRIDIGEMSAARIEVLRRPEGEGRTIETRTFELPELPVSVDIGTLRADEVRLGETVLGQALRARVEGSLSLASGAGSARLALMRTDGVLGELSFQGNFSNATGEGTLDLLAREGAGGIAASLLGLPDRPAAELALHGSGTSADFRADLALTTDDEPRVSGTAQTFLGPANERQFALSLGGDITPLLAPDYRAFFGSDATLEAEGQGTAEGGLRLSRLVIETAGFGLSGRIALAPGGLPEDAALTLRLGLPDGKPVVLPLPGEPVSAEAGVVRLRFDADDGSWQMEGDFGAFSRAGLSAGSLALAATGTVTESSAPGRLDGRVAGRIDMAIGDLRADDPALAAALGSDLTGAMAFLWQQGAPFRIAGMNLQAGDARLSGDMVLRSGGLDLAVEGRAALVAADLSRFSMLADAPLAGSAELVAEGRLLALSRGFDGTVVMKGTDLSIGQPQADRLLRGASALRVSAVRDGSGILLRAFDLTASTLSLTGSGRASSNRTDLSARLDVPDLSDIDPQLAGAAEFEAMLRGVPGARTLDLTGEGGGLRSGQALIDPLLAGRTDLDVRLEEKSGTFHLSSARLTNPAISFQAAASGPAGGIGIDARIANFGLIAPEFPGPLTVTGTVLPTDPGFRVDLSALGPAGSRARLSGTADRNFGAVDLALSGDARLEVLNRQIAPRSVQGRAAFDLRLRGAPGVGTLSGRVATTDARLALPEENIGIEGLSLAADIANGSAAVAGQGRFRDGGSVSLSGRIGIGPPFDADLAATLTGVVVRRPGLLESQLGGQVALSGPLKGGGTISGLVTLEETQITVVAPGPDFGFLPEIQHRNESHASRATRVRAGLTGDGRRRGVGGAVHALDLVVNAPARVFVRGFGLDAELGGRLRLQGTTADIRPAGEISLIRGRFSLLGQRFVLDQGLVQLQGSLVPTVDFTALADTESGTTTIRLFGPADRPAVQFSSTSGLPEEEVIAELLFGSRLENLSTFQLVQLANAIASLGGGGGGDGVGSRLRRTTRLDDLDIVADEDGNATLRLGKYLTDRIYGEATLGEDGTSRIDLNLQVRPGLDLKAGLGTEGESGLGVFYSRDY